MLFKKHFENFLLYLRMYSGLCVSLRCVVVGCQVPSCYPTGENSDQSEAASEGRHRCGSSDTRDPRGGESEGPKNTATCVSTTCRLF